MESSVAETADRIHQRRLQELQKTGGRTLMELGRETSRRVREARTARRSPR